MTKGTRVVRRRKADEEAKHAQSEAVAEEPKAEPAKPAPVKARPKIERRMSELHEDLQAIADMDMSELDALMSTNQPKKRYEPGDPARGHITAISGQHAFVGLGTKAEATIDRSELDNPAVGDLVESFVQYSDASGIHLSKKLTGEAANTAIAAAINSELPVEGVVLSKNAGGFTVQIGSIRAFCPISQMSRYHVEDGEQFIGQTLKFHVLEGGDNVVVSRRAFEDELASAMAESFWLEVQEGNTYQGTVRSVKDFGVFVDISGAEGLVPRRELSWGGEVGDVAIGQALEVRVIQLDRDSKRLTLSAKDPGLSPWNLVGTKFSTGQTYSGHVVKLTDFGAFVELAPGLQGLLHLSQMGGVPPEVGEVIDVQIQQIDHDRQRLSLGVSTVQDDSEIGTEVSGNVHEVLRAGLIVLLEDGRKAWLSIDDANVPANTTLAQRFRRGRTVKARIKQFDQKRNRVVLSQKDTLENDAWRADLRAQKAEGFGTFAELFKGVKVD